MLRDLIGDPEVEASREFTLMEARDLLHARTRLFELSLRIRHPSLDPAVISHELRLQPEHSFKAGEPRESSSGIAAAAVHPESYWLARLNPVTWPAAVSAFDMSFPGRPRLAVSKERLRSMVTDSLALALTLCTTHLLRTHAGFVRRVQAEGGEVGLIVEISCSAMQGFTLTPSIARVLADLGVGIEFELVND